ncbi:MAG: sugar kinase [bacterium]|jgi:sugar/nucleoside kinase (ribokinase family)|nr:sugar kinase [bacterium]MDD3806203.1 sugar kinase [bacterium]MDD4152133.1 sugar kinase [bacterium]MDD4558861.1 sugar kinase [bacterium]
MLEVTTLGILVADVVAKPVEELPDKGKLALVSQMELHSGGCAANTGIALAKIGLKTGIIGKVGDDGFGDFMVNACNHYGLDTRGIVRSREMSTSATMVMVDSSGERTFLHHTGANGDFEESDINYTVVAQSQLIHIAGHFLMPKFDGRQAAEALKRIRKMGIKTSLDTAWDATGRWMFLLKPCLQHLDIFLPSLDEAQQISGLKEPRDIARFFMDCGIELIAIKMGSKGSYATDGENELIMPPFMVEAVDAVGAGDSFVAGFLTGIMRGWDLEKTLKFANATGALCVTAIGATTGIRSFEETLEFMEKTPLK